MAFKGKNSDNLKLSLRNVISSLKRSASSIFDISKGRNSKQPSIEIISPFIARSSEVEEFMKPLREERQKIISEAIEKGVLFDPAILDNPFEAGKSNNIPAKSKEPRPKDYYNEKLNKDSSGMYADLEDEAELLSEFEDETPPKTKAPLNPHQMKRSETLSNIGKASPDLNSIRLAELAETETKHGKIGFTDEQHKSIDAGVADLDKLLAELENPKKVPTTSKPLPLTPPQTLRKNTLTQIGSASLELPKADQKPKMKPVSTMSDRELRSVIEDALEIVTEKTQQTLSNSRNVEKLLKTATNPNIREELKADKARLDAVFDKLFSSTIELSENVGIMESKHLNRDSSEDVADKIFNKSGKRPDLNTTNLELPQAKLTGAERKEPSGEKKLLPKKPISPETIAKRAMLDKDVDLQDYQKASELMERFGKEELDKVVARAKAELESHTEGTKTTKKDPFASVRDRKPPTPEEHAKTQKIRKLNSKMENLPTVASRTPNPSRRALPELPESAPKHQAPHASDVVPKHKAPHASDVVPKHQAPDTSDVVPKNEAPQAPKGKRKLSAPTSEAPTPDKWTNLVSKGKGPNDTNGLNR